MKSKVFGLFAAIGLAVTASADDLLWQVPDTRISATDIYGKSQTISQSSGDYAWTYALLQYTDASKLTIDVASGNNSYVASYYQDTALPNGQANIVLAGKTLAGDLTAQSIPSGANYYIALYNSANKLMGYSQYLENISDFTAASRNIADWVGVNSANGGSSGWTAAPEPTSGVLLLLGAAVLGLRRRKVA